MQFPFVSREQYEQVKGALTSANLKYAALFERYHELVMKDHELPSTVVQSLVQPPISLVTPPKRSVIAEAIREESQGDPRLARFLTRRARELKAEMNLNDEQIAAQLQNWETTESEDVA